MKIELWTDGACRGNGQKAAIGGWAFLIKDDNDIVYWKDAGATQNTTNNQMELTAVLRGLKRIDEMNPTPNDIIAPSYFEPGFSISVTVYSDSAYLQRCWEEKWYKNWQKNGWKNSKKEPVKNRELWEALIPYFENSNYTFEKVQGHNGIQYNEIVDTMATSAADRLAKELK